MLIVASLNPPDRSTLRASTSYKSYSHSPCCFLTTHSLHIIARGGSSLHEI